ncbi:alanine aminotransferase 1-like [Hippoglossus hippoglossus]|uniref:alanine aminotransferase 1-like n=1 Tax=Hippoglossus hippoglossus TaxID=8267 RepID=UPI00148C2EA4|nr:alanine aminotransferase 1-like [Hippoglossus hippoglossus]
MSSLQQVNPRVRGMRTSPHAALQSLAARITQEITQGAQRSFKEVIDLTSGDPQRAGMKSISFVRQVLAACLCPHLLKDTSLPLDVRLRAQSLLDSCDGGSVGAYTPSAGLARVRQSIAEFLTRRDAGAPSYSRDVYISAGSQVALMLLVKLLASGEGETPTGVLTPVPSPHTLPGLLDEEGVTLVPYRLTEERGWALELSELHRALKASRGHCNPRAIYVSNPGIPTGHVQDRKSIEEVIRFALTNPSLSLSLQVYQDSVFGSEFVSYKRVLFQMDKVYSESVELVSFHSLSSGRMGEGGLRAGFMEAVNMDPEVTRYVHVMLCFDISAPVTGQLALDLMVDPPKPGDASYDTYTQEILSARATLSHNAQRAWQILNGLPGMSCQPAMGGVYLYPSVRLPAGILEQAEMLGVEPDVLYCQRFLQEEGVLVGAGLHHGGDTHHLRLCVLVPPDSLEEALTRLSSFHLRLVDRFSQCEGQRRARNSQREDLSVS